MVFTDQYGSADDYRYLLVNNYVGQAMLEIHPVSRESAILPPQTGAFTPMIMWYLRNCARVPMIAYNTDPAEFCNPELMLRTSFNPATDEIQTQAGNPNSIGIPQQGVVGAFPGSIPYVTGDIIKFQTQPGTTLPAPLVAGTNYYVIAMGNGVIKVATTLANAVAGIPIDITDQGAGGAVTLYVAATENIVLATLIDIPEFSEFTMQWVKCCCMAKDKDPGLSQEVSKLESMKKQMVDTLTNGIPDDDDTIEPDFSAYQELS